HEELAQLDAEIERQQARSEMGTRELKSAAEIERETEAVHQPESEGEQPATLQPGADDVLEGHIEHRQRDRHFDQRREPERSARPPPGRKRTTVVVSRPSRAKAGRMLKLARSESMGYSSRTSSSACCQTSSVAAGSAAPFSRASALS